MAPDVVAADPPTNPDGMAHVLAAQRPSLRADQGPVFHSMFQSEDRRGPVGALVAELWGANPAHAAPSAMAPASNPARAALPVSPAPVAVVPAAAGSPLDLFQETLPAARRLFGGPG
jgi:hypothetical protein